MYSLYRALGVSLALLSAVPAIAQPPARCGTEASHAAQLQRTPALGAFEAQLEREWNQVDQSARPMRGGVRRIPVVVHIIQSSALVRITDGRVQSQIDVLNEDFRKMNADTSNIPAPFVGVASDTEIEFCLATIDPNGCPTNGINRIISPENAHHEQDDEEQLKALIQWNPRMYLNIWVPEEVPTLLGYATFPTSLSFAPELDGVVVNGQNFGRGNGIPASTYDLGRTATHEVGHWLGLFHTFQGGCGGGSPSTCSTGGDRICDTPPTANANYSCPGTKNTCTETPTDLNDQTNNYMDYVDDRCMNMFTEGQKTRMDFMLANLRSQLWSPSNLAATGCDGSVSPGCAPVAAFRANLTAACPGVPIHFTDLSTGPATSWQWNFQGGSPGSDTSASPVVTYSQAGTYTVSLTVSNSVGQDSVVSVGYIQIDQAGTVPFQEGFEVGTASLPSGWMVLDEDALGSWRRTNTAGSVGSSSVYLPIYTLNGDGLSDGLITAPFSLSQMGSALLTYDWAYKRRSAFAIDSFSVWVSTDCGESWDKVREKSGVALATTAGLQLSSPYVPTPAHWKTDSVDLSAYAGAANVKVQFRCKSGAGQNLYLDQVNLDGIVGLSEVEPLMGAVEVFPNPSAYAPTVRYTLLKSSPVAVSLRALDGRAVWETVVSKAGSGTHTLDLPESMYSGLPAGVYLLRLEGEGRPVWAKVVKFSNGQ